MVETIFSFIWDVFFGSFFHPSSNSCIDLIILLKSTAIAVRSKKIGVVAPDQYCLSCSFCMFYSPVRYKACLYLAPLRSRHHSESTYLWCWVLYWLRLDWKSLVIRRWFALKASRKVDVREWWWDSSLLKSVLSWQAKVGQILRCLSKFLIFRVVWGYDVKFRCTPGNTAGDVSIGSNLWLNEVSDF